MKSKIFKATLFLVILSIPVLQCLSQVANPIPPPPPPVFEIFPPIAPLTMDSNFSGKMKELNLKMRQLQKEMSKLNTEQMKKQTLAMQTFSRKQLQQVQKMTEGLTYVMPQVNVDFDFHGNQNLQDEIKSGQVKEKIKNYTKSYPVNSNDQLHIDNRYGKVTVNTWNKNEFKVDVEMKVAANDEDEAQKLLNDISISDSKEGTVVTFRTNFGNENQGVHLWSNWNNGSHNVRNMEVNYVVYMPTKNSLDISNKYGAIIMPDFEGKLNINSSYGSFTAKNLTHTASDINCKYGSATIDGLAGSDLKVAYGNLTLGTGDNLNTEVSYGSAKIAKLKTSGNISLKYSGGLKIDDLDKNLKSLTVNSSYSSVSLGVDNIQNMDFDVSVRYGSFNYGNDRNISITNKTPDDGERGWNPSKTYKGHLGKGNTEKLITIRSNYGSVKFNSANGSL